MLVNQRSASMSSLDRLISEMRIWKKPARQNSQFWELKVQILCNLIKKMFCIQYILLLNYFKM